MTVDFPQLERIIIITIADVVVVVVVAVDGVVVVADVASLSMVTFLSREVISTYCFVHHNLFHNYNTRTQFHMIYYT